MPQNDSMLQAIAAEPDDDALRLIYADWVEDHGDPARAEFIRLQCELARLPEGQARQRKLAAQERKLLKAHGSSWRGWITHMGFDTVFRRGFLDEVTLSAEIFVEQARPLAEIPTLRLVGLRDIRGNLKLVRTIAGLPELGRLRGLRFEPIDLHLCSMTPEPGFTAGLGLTGDGLELLLWSPHVSQLETLELPKNKLNNRTGEILAAADHLHSLRSLSLRHNWIEDDGLAALAEAPHLGSLRKLDLSDAFFRLPGLQALVHSPHLTGLTELDLSGNRLLTAGVQELARHFPFANLTTLKLNRQNIQRTAAEALARCPQLGQLEVLELNRNKIGDKGSEALAGSPYLANLKVLRLRSNGITVQGVEALAASKYLQKLEVLDLGSNSVDADEKKTLRARFGKGFAKF